MSVVDDVSTGFVELASRIQASIRAAACRWRDYERIGPFVALAEQAFANGITCVFLMAHDDAEARIYARAGAPDETGDGVPTAYEHLRELAADEPAGAGDEDPPLEQATSVVAGCHQLRPGRIVGRRSTASCRTRNLQRPPGNE